MSNGSNSYGSGNHFLAWYHRRGEVFRPDQRFPGSTDYALEDPLDGALVVTLDQLPVWSLDEHLLDTPPDPECAFRLDHALNRKISVWRGAGWRLRVDCLVVGNSETLVDRTGERDARARVFARARAAGAPAASASRAFQSARDSRSRSLASARARGSRGDDESGEAL